MVTTPPRWEPTQMVTMWRVFQLSAVTNACACNCAGSGSYRWVHSSVVRAADCRSAGPWFKSGCALVVCTGGHRERRGEGRRLCKESGHPESNQGPSDRCRLYSQMLCQLSYSRSCRSRAVAQDPSARLAGVSCASAQTGPRSVRTA